MGEPRDEFHAAAAGELRRAPDQVLLQPVGLSALVVAIMHQVFRVVLEPHVGALGTRVAVVHRETHDVFDVHPDDQPRPKTHRVLRKALAFRIVVRRAVAPHIALCACRVEFCGFRHDDVQDAFRREYSFMSGRRVQRVDQFDAVRHDFDVLVPAGVEWQHVCRREEKHPVHFVHFDWVRQLVDVGADAEALVVPVVHRPELLPLVRLQVGVAEDLFLFLRLLGFLLEHRIVRPDDHVGHVVRIVVSQKCAHATLPEEWKCKKDAAYIIAFLMLLSNRACQLLCLVDKTLKISIFSLYSFLHRLLKKEDRLENQRNRGNMLSVLVQRWTNGQFEMNINLVSGRGPTTTDLNSKILEMIWEGLMQDGGPEKAENFVAFVRNLRDLSASSFIVAFEKFYKSGCKDVMIPQSESDRSVLERIDTEGPLFALLSAALCNKSGASRELREEDIEIQSVRLKAGFLRDHAAK